MPEVKNKHIRTTFKNIVMISLLLTLRGHTFLDIEKAIKHQIQANFILFKAVGASTSLESIAKLNVIREQLG